MTYAFIQDVPGNAELYAQIDARIRASLPTEAPVGLISHTVIEQDTGLRYVDVWTSFDDWERFRVDHVEPSVGAVLGEHGLAHNHDLVTITEVTVIDTWIGQAAPV
jgi:hypothetical protein